MVHAAHCRNFHERVWTPYPLHDVRRLWDTHACEENVARAACRLRRPSGVEGSCLVQRIRMGSFAQERFAPVTNRVVQAQQRIHLLYAGTLLLARVSLLPWVVGFVILDIFPTKCYVFFVILM